MILSFLDIIALCPQGWVYFSGGCYHYEGAKSTWDDALTACVADESQLVEINSAAENTFLANLIKNDQNIVGSGVWIGLNVVYGTQIWIPSENFTSYTNWASGEPDNDHGMVCVEMYPDGMLNDKICDVDSTFLCEKPSIVKTCDEGWSVFNKRCFRFIAENRRWEEAQNSCIARGGGLAQVTSAAENEFLFNMREEPSPYVNNGFWIGLKLVNDTFIWYSFGNVPSYLNWDIAEPNNYQNDEECVEMNPNGRWNDNDCNIYRMYFCEKPPIDKTCEEGWSVFNTRCFRFIEDYKRWEEAQNSCIARGGELAQVTSAAENEFLFNMIKEPYPYVNNGFWIGLKLVDGTYIWNLSGKVASYLNWDLGEPNNYQNDEKCVEMNPNGRWNDNNCNIYRMYFCEKP